ncbi:MAG: flagellar protein FlgN [Ruminococcus sp.]|nr:flagellar protein FlgN [Ruminococcus sp.]
MDYPALIAFFDEYNAHFRNFLKFEYGKMDMLHKGEIEKLSNSLSAEQAFIMKSSSLEKRRIGLTGDNVTFADIVESAPEEYKSALDERYKALSEMVLKIKEINDTANLIVTERLKRIRVHSGELDTYNGHGDVKKENAVTSTMSRNA